MLSDSVKKIFISKQATVMTVDVVAERIRLGKEALHGCFTLSQRLLAELPCDGTKNV